jgi:hypothetical protein
MLGRLVRLALAGAIAALAVPAIPAPAQDLTPPLEPSPAALAEAAPVTISACSITRRPRYRNMTYPYPLPVTGGLRIAFVNRGTSAAKEIHFRVDYRGESEVISDSGNFAPTTLASHSFENFSDYAYLGPTPNLCAVIFVRFADGTVWNGVPRGQLRRPL